MSLKAVAKTEFGILGWQFEATLDWVLQDKFKHQSGIQVPWGEPAPLPGAAPSLFSFLPDPLSLLCVHELTLPLWIRVSLLQPCNLLLSRENKYEYYTLYKGAPPPHFPSAWGIICYSNYFVCLPYILGFWGQKPSGDRYRSPAHSTVVGTQQVSHSNVLKWVTLSLWMGSGCHSVFKTDHQYVYLWVIHVDIWRKPTQYCKAIILIKNK